MNCHNKTKKGWKRQVFMCVWHYKTQIWIPKLLNPDDVIAIGYLGIQKLYPNQNTNLNANQNSNPTYPQISYPQNKVQTNLTDVIQWW